jgi:serine protease Do
MQKFSKPFVRIFSAAVGALLVVTAFRLTLWAKDTAPNITVSSTPINRDVKLGTSFAPMVKKVAPSVVNIYSKRFVKERPARNPFQDDPFFRQFFGNQVPDDTRERTLKERSLGSGVIVSPDGYILTANHVVADADEVRVTIADNKKEFVAKIVGKDAATDVAVLKIDADNLPAVTLGDSDQLEIGDLVLAIGNPFNVGKTVTMGIVSALGRSGLHLNAYEDFIQTDAAINPGNSGGALIDAEGRLIGINTAIKTETGGYQGIGYAVPVNMARHVMERLIAGGKLTRGYLGVVPQDIDAGLAQEFSLPDQNGALVGDVQPDSPAAKAGIKSGDVILSVNGREISGAEDLKVNISQLEPASQAALKIIRDGSSKTVAVTLGELPELAENDSASQNNSAPQNYKADGLDGVTVADIDSDVRSALKIPDSVSGAIVAEVEPDSNSAEAGLLKRDVIVEINHQPVADAGAAVKLCKNAEGGQILVKIWRRLGGYAGTRYLSVDNARRAN